MAPFLLQPRVVLMAAALSIPCAASGACGSRTACLAYTQAEYDVNHGACLAPADALTAFTSPLCPGSIVSVDGPGSFDGEICCYPVTYDNVDQSCNTGNGGGSTDTFPSTTTFVGPTTTNECAGSCNEALFTGVPPCGGVALDNFITLQACAACTTPIEPDGGQGCAPVCFMLCSNAGVDPSCQSCLQSSCPTVLLDCQES